MSSQGRKAGSRAGLGTSSGRPMTGRPMTASVRPGTSAGGMGNKNESTTLAEEDQYQEEYDEEDEYESEDDGDVFAFVPRE